MRTSIVAVSLSLLIPASPSLAQLGLSPPRFEFAIGDRPVTETARVFNFGNDTSRVHVTVHNWDLDVANKVRLLPPTEQSLDQWLAINPLEFAIPPRGSQTVRFSVRPRVTPTQGEHRAIIYFTEEAKYRGDYNDIKVGLRLGAAVYGQVGPTDRRGMLNGVAVDANAARFDVTSSGTSHIRLDGQYAVWAETAYPGSEETAAIDNLDESDESAVELPPWILAADVLPTTPFLPRTRRTLVVEFEQAVPPGHYVLDINASLGEEPIDRGIRFTVPMDRQIQVAD